MARMDDSMELEEEEIEMDADDDPAYNVNVIMPPPKPSIFPVKSKPRVASHWSDLSQDWNAEETGKIRPLETLYGCGVHKATGKNSRGFVEYEDNFEGGSKKIGARLDFERRKPSWEMEKVQQQQTLKTLGVDGDDDEGEVHSDEGANKSEPEDDESAWSKRLKGPRMRMYADEEEANRRRNIKIQQMYGQNGAGSVSSGKPRASGTTARDLQSVQERSPISQMAMRNVRSRRLSRDETTTGLGQRIFLDHHDSDDDDDKDESYFDHGAGATRRSKYEDEDEFMRRNLYAQDMNRIAHRPIDRNRQKPSIKDRLGVRTPPQLNRQNHNRTPVKERLGFRPTRRFLDRD